MFQEIFENNSIPHSFTAIPHGHYEHSQVQRTMHVIGVGERRIRDGYCTIESCTANTYKHNGNKRERLRLELA